MAHDTNGTARAVDTLMKRIMHANLGSTSLRTTRIRPLLHAGKLNWELLVTITPRRNAKSLHFLDI